MKRIIKFSILITLSMFLVACSSEEKVTVGKDEGTITIYMIRHGKTWFNTTEQVQGFSDTPLTEEGLSMTEKSGESLKDVKFDLAFTGTLGRQISTAEVILEKNTNPVPEIIEHVGFNEWNYGGFEGKTNEEMWNAVGKDHGYKYDSEWNFYEGLYEKLGDEGIADEIAKQDPWKNAETYEEITTRGLEAMDALVESAKEYDNPTVLVVSSGSMIPTILKEIAPESYNGEGLDNLSLTVVEYNDGNYKVELIGDTTYMD